MDLCSFKQRKHFRTLKCLQLDIFPIQLKPTLRVIVQLVMLLDGENKRDKGKLNEPFEERGFGSSRFAKNDVPSVVYVGTNA